MPADELPARVMRAKMIRVHSHDVVEVDLDLGYGTHVHRRLIIEGIDRHSIPKEQRDAAFHSMLVLLGGRTKLLVQTDDFREDGPFRARVFLDQKVELPPPGTMHAPYGMREQRLEVGQFFSWLAKQGYSKDAVVRTLSGDGPVPQHVIKRVVPRGDPRRQPRATVATRAG
jgi:hypothetical protein